MGMSGRLHIGDAPELLLARSVTESEVDNFRCRLHAGIARTSCQNTHYSSSSSLRLLPIVVHYCASQGSFGFRLGY